MNWYTHHVLDRFAMNGILLLGAALLKACK